ncbi:hypothetical protein HNQ80_002109 [Anaerosolibacter carboniphilus]|uniref:Uncharacterized protein n=1 Tax=Anaerosolibacter carboniphilus TaxID=1417629 RepID=A0A841KV03_9FIRM|nr:hypothetical protein [Anaerosolibacter carboniphilus]MBB6216018.1 hypothetical protein [Anaerosolibacter carboniphilus]
MDTHLLEEKFNLFSEGNMLSFENEPEVYYFALGRVLKWVFAEIGGIDRHRNEFNYLTNPYMPADIRTLSIRIVTFLKKSKLHSKIQNRELISMIHLILSREKILDQVNASLRLCENAFYAGLYWKD